MQSLKNIFILLIAINNFNCGFNFYLNKNEDDWRDNTLIYQIWPRAFQDSDGDGEGDLKGIISRLDYLSDIGIETIRLGSIYSTASPDSEYEILNHTDINPIYGDFDDFDELIEEAHKRDLKVILDVIPNHSSNQHDWFRLSVKGEEPYDDYYFWTDGKFVNKKHIIRQNDTKIDEENDNESFWTWHIVKRQWYYHTLEYTKPDLNLGNEDVIQEILDIFEFWLNKDVDGFYLKGVSHFFNKKDLPDIVFDNDDKDDDKDDDDDDDGDDDDNNDEEKDTDSVHKSVKLLHRFRDFINQWVESNKSPPKLLIAEILDSDEDQPFYDENITIINLSLITKLNNTSNAEDFKAVIEEELKDSLFNKSLNWMFSNENHPRISTEFDENIADALNMLTLLLPGQAFIYFGEEIGMTTFCNRTDNLGSEIDCCKLDEELENEAENNICQDVFTTPMQWNDNTISAGFSANESTYVPPNPDYLEINVEEQMNESESSLQIFKNLSALRKHKVFVNGDYEIKSVKDDEVFIMKRFLDNNPMFFLIINFGFENETLNLEDIYDGIPEVLEVVMESDNSELNKKAVSSESILLFPRAALVLSTGSSGLSSSVGDSSEEEMTTEDISAEQKIAHAHSFTSSTTDTPITVVPVPIESSTEKSAAIKASNQSAIALGLIILVIISMS